MPKHSFHTARAAAIIAKFATSETASVEEAAAALSLAINLLKRIMDERAGTQEAQSDKKRNVYH